ncbi:MAG: GTP 3',8-cyclase MoaA [Thermodesulfobacteriota bacterium]|nr:GTP 3',8-cyclase MoaA [Thermodesulfobacteriota bacterium]
MKDNFGRNIEYLRISLTDRCNFRCTYCMPIKGIDLVSHQEILTFEEIYTLAIIFSQKGIRHIRFTGGEPLLRKGICNLIAMVNSIPKIEDVTLTTNGFFLENMADKLKEAGLSRINISLDTFNPIKFEKITKSGDLNAVLRGIDRAIAVGFSPIKLNYVVMRGINDDEILSFIEFADKKGIEIKFIELMPNNTNNFPVKMFQYLLFSGKEIREKIPYKMKKREKTGMGPEESFILENGVKIGFINAISHNFCHLCNRIRVSSTGLLAPCLMSSVGINLKKGLRPKVRPELLNDLIDEALLNKPEGHDNYDFISDMSRIGG